MAQWTYSTSIPCLCLPTFEDPLFLPFWEHVPYLVATPVLVPFSLLLMIWWDPFSGRSRRKSCGCILVGLTLLFCSLEAWRVAWLGPKSLAHTCLEFCENIISLCMRLLKSLLPPWLSLLDTWTFKSKTQRIFEVFKCSLVVRCLWRLSWVEFSRNICTLSIYGLRFSLICRKFHCTWVLSISLLIVCFSCRSFTCMFTRSSLPVFLDTCSWMCLSSLFHLCCLPRFPSSC